MGIEKLPSQMKNEKQSLAISNGIKKKNNTQNFQLRNMYVLKSKVTI